MATPTPASSIRSLPSLSKTPTPVRLILKDKELDLREQIGVQKAARETTEKKLSGVKERIARLESMAAELQQTRERHESLAEASVKAREERRQPIPGVGMLTFQTGGFGAGNPTSTSKGGRNSRRTAYTVDFRGVPIIGESEWVARWKIENSAEKLIEERAKERQENATPSVVSTAPKAPRFGANGLPTLEFCSHCSSRRMRFYVNYEGKRIMMDPCDWPSDKGFVLTGK
jgi:hypothetical protein